MLALCELLLAIVVTLFAIQYAKMLYSRARYPPGPTPLPLFGSMWTLRFQLHPETFKQLANTYGSIFTVWLGHTPVVVLNGCETIRNALLSYSDELSGRPLIPIFQKLSRGKGVVFTSGNPWKQQRRFAFMAMRNLGLGKKCLEGRIQTEAQHLIELFTKTNEKPTDPSHGITHCITNIIASVVFGHRFSIEEKNYKELIEANNTMITFLCTRWARFYDTFPQLMEHLPGPLQHFIKAIEVMETYVKEEIKSHKENGIPLEPQDIVDSYLAQISKTSDDPNSTYDDENMIHFVVELFGAGIETTTTTLRWALLYMVTHPDIQGKVQKELDTVLGDSQIITYEDHNRLPYTNAVIHEIQRYCNAQSIGLFRQSLKKISLQGYTIEKGTIIIANLYSSLYDPDHWETPRKFNPGHFLGNEGNFITNEAFLPFSIGTRMCLGKQLATIKLFIIFTSLLRMFTFHLPEDVKQVNTDYILESTLKPHPYKICAVPR